MGLMSSEPPVLPPEPPPSSFAFQPSPEQPSPSSAPERLPSGNDSRLLAEARGLGWNWGGFLLPYLWLIGHGRVTPALVLWISMGLPFLGFLHLFLYPATAIYLGLNGFEVSWRYRSYHSVAGLQESEREWMIWGVVLNLLVIFSVFISLVYFRTMFTGMWEGMESMGW
jgi:hypothetical protein